MPRSRRSSSSPGASFVRQLAAVCSVVYTEPEAIAEFSRDWWPVYQLKEPDPAQLPIAAALPMTTQEVAAVVRLAAEQDRPVIVRGGASNLIGAIAPMPGAVILDTHGLDVIGLIDEDSTEVIVDSGVMVSDLDNRLIELDLTLCDELPTAELSTVGGWIAMNANGFLATGNGGIRRHLRGVELVEPNGTVRRLVEPEDAAALDALVGAVHPPQIITSATLAVRRIPGAQRVVAFDMPEFGKALRSLQSFIARGERIDGMLLLSAGVSILLADLYELDEARNLLIVWFEGEFEELDARIEDIVKHIYATGGVQCTQSTADNWWDIRLEYDWLIDGNDGEGQLTEVFTLDLPWTDLETTLDDLRRAIETHGTCAFRATWLQTETVRVEVVAGVAAQDIEKLTACRNDVYREIAAVCERRHLAPPRNRQSA